MDGIRFYADYGSKKAKRRGGDAPNALGILIDAKRFEDKDVMYDAVAAVFDHKNSGVATTGVSRGYLRESCKRISESEARRIHPNLFALLR